MTRAEAREINKVRKHAERLAELAELAVGVLTCYIDNNEDALTGRFDSGVGVYDIEESESMLRKLKKSYKNRVEADD